MRPVSAPAAAGALAWPPPRRRRRGFCGMLAFYKCPPGGFPARGCGAFGPLPGPLRLAAAPPAALAPGLRSPVRSGPGAPPGPLAAARWGRPGRCAAAPAPSPRALGPAARRPLAAARPCGSGRALPAPPVPCPRCGPPRVPLPRPAPSGRLRPRSLPPGGVGGGVGYAALLRLSPPAAPGRGGLGRGRGLRLRRWLRLAALGQQRWPAT